MRQQLLFMYFAIKSNFLFISKYFLRSVGDGHCRGVLVAMLQCVKGLKGHPKKPTEKSTGFCNSLHPHKIRLPSENFLVQVGMENKWRIRKQLGNIFKLGTNEVKE